MKLDKLDARILSLLQGNGRISNVELAEIVGLSESPTFRRVRQLEKSGLIQSYAAILDRRKLGYEVMAFVQITMEKQPDAATEQFHRRVEEEPHIVECHAMSGSHDYLLRVVARNIDHFSELCMNKILKFPGVQHIESSFSLKEYKSSQILPVAPR